MCTLRCIDRGKKNEVEFSSGRVCAVPAVSACFPVSRRSGMVRSFRIAFCIQHPRSSYNEWCSDRSVLSTYPKPGSLRRDSNPGTSASNRRTDQPRHPATTLRERALILKSLLAHSFLRALVKSGFAAQTLRHRKMLTDLRRRPYLAEYTRSHLNSEVKLQRARQVPRRGTARENLRVLSAFYDRVPACTFCFSPYTSMAVPSS